MALPQPLSLPQPPPLSDPWVVAWSTLAGSLARWYLLRVDYRQYPSYPQGYAIHLSLGLVAAFLGALAVPALVAREYAAASFLALAATQFREVRKIEREALLQLEETELVRRGSAYIEGIARVFEARNYVTMLAAILSAALLSLLRPSWWAAGLLGLGCAAAVVATAGKAGRGLRLGDIARVRPAALRFDGPLLTVEGAVVVNVGRAESRDTFLRMARAFVIEPLDEAAAATLANPGQRQALLHDLVARVGVRMDVDEPEFAPLARRRAQDGSVVVVLIPVLQDVELMLDTLRRVPVLEAGVRVVGQAARDGLSPRRLQGGGGGAG
ncbi:MAG TPA: YIEGIA domain-containing protein [Limnochordales bacterium]